MMITDPEKPHLGGFVDGPIGDEATYFPALWVWLVNDLKISSVIDVGAGSGIAVDFFETLLPGSVIGIEGMPQKQENIILHDYTTGPKTLRTYFDLCWCVEFVEHVDEQFVPNFLATFKCAKTILMTHAMPGQNGWHHVNCRTPQYWLGVMAAIGYRFDEELTTKTRELASLNTNIYNHYRRSGMAFTRN